jgi:hypothetical protein
MPQWRVHAMTTELIIAFDDASLAEIAAMSQGVPGVAEVSHLAFDIDDTIMASAPPLAASDPLRGCWIGHPPAWSVGGATHSRLPDHSAYAQNTTRTAMQ